GDRCYARCPAGVHFFGKRMDTAQFTVALSNGKCVTGSLLAGTVRCDGQDLDARSIIALDDKTLFLFGPTQVDVKSATDAKLKGFLELDVAGVGPTKLTLAEVETIFRHPH